MTSENEAAFWSTLSQHSRFKGQERQKVSPGKNVDQILHSDILYLEILNDLAINTAFKYHI